MGVLWLMSGGCATPEDIAPPSVPELEQVTVEPDNVPPSEVPAAAPSRGQAAPTDVPAPRLDAPPTPTSLTEDAPTVADPWAGAPSDAQARLAWVEQTVLPGLAARQAAAEARALAWERAATGEGMLAEAIAPLTTQDLLKPGLLAAKVRELDRQAERRGQELAASVPDLPDDRLELALAALAETHRAEARIDDLERDQFLRLRGWLQSKPYLRHEALVTLLSPWVASSKLPDTIGEDDAQALAALEAQQQVGQMWQAMTAVIAANLFDQSVTPAVEAVLARPPSRAQALTVVLLMEGLVGAERAALETRLGPMLSALPALTTPTDPEELRALQQRLSIGVADAPPAWKQVVGQDLEAVEGALAALVDVERQEALAEAETRAQAEAARRTENAAAEHTAALMEARIPAQKRLADVRARVEALRTSSEEEREASEVTLSQVEAALVALQGGSEASDLDSRYAALRQETQRLRKAIAEYGAEGASAAAHTLTAQAARAQERAKIQEARGALNALAVSEAQAARETALKAWESVLDEEAQSVETWKSMAREAQMGTAARLSRAVRLREALSGEVSVAEQERDRDGLLIEAGQELGAVGPTYVGSVRSRWNATVADPWWFLSLSTLGDMVLGSFWILVTAGLWVALRRYSDTLVALVIQAIERRSEIWLPEDLARLRDPLDRLIETAVDVVAAWMLLGVVSDGIPELALVLLVALQVQFIRLVLAIYDLAITSDTGVRPAWVRLNEADWLLGRRTVLLLAVWTTVFSVLDVLVLNVVAGFATGTILDAVQWILLAFIAVGLLYAWSDAIRRRVLRHPRQSALTRLLGTAPPLRLLNGPQSVGGLAFVLVVLLRDLAFRVARIGFLGQWFSAIDRLRFGFSSDDTDDAHVPLPAKAMERLLTDVSKRAFADRPGARAALGDAVRAWESERRGGLIALLGDSGDGRSVSMRAWMEDWTSNTSWVGVDSRLCASEDAYGWLASLVGSEAAPASVDEAVALLDEHLGAGVVVVSGLHLSFLRSVGGFDALRTLLEVFHADQERCWILCFYRPAWRYLERLGTTMNMHLVQTIVDLTGLESKDLRALTTTLAQASGHQLNFDGLASTGALAGDLDVERERAIESYYRLLSSASHGNPSIALDLWARSLTEVPDADGDGDPEWTVRILPEMRGADLPSLGDEQLFVLAALRVQGELRESELTEVLNMGASKVRSLVRQLRSDGLVVEGKRGLQVRHRRLPAVTTLLRRRNFLHWGA